MSWRSRSRRLAILGFIALLVLISIEGAAQVREHLDPEKPRPDVAELHYGPFAERPGSLEGSAPARSFRSGARCGLLPRRRVCRRRQEECAGVAGGPLPGGGDLGGLG